MRNRYRLLVVFAASAVCLAGCGILEPGFELFDEARAYAFTEPDCVQTDPEMPCSADVTFCPDGTADYRGLGSDIIERGAYRVMGSRVRVTLRQSDDHRFFTLSGDGLSLVEDTSGNTWTLVADGDSCP